MDALSQYIRFFEDNVQAIESHAPEVLNRARADAMRRISGTRMPRLGDERFPALSLEEVYAPDYGINVNRVPMAVDAAGSFRCGVPNVSTLLAIVAGDAYISTDTLLRNLPQGVTVMSLARAAKEQPELVGKYYDRLVVDKSNDSDPTPNLNTLLCQDGVLVHIDKDVKLDKPLQIVSIANAVAPMMTVRRLLVIMEPGAEARMLMCDHSDRKDVDYLNTYVAEIYLGENSLLDYYELEESSPRTSRNAVIYCQQQSGSKFTANGCTLMGGRSRNAYVIDAPGNDTRTYIYGMAIASDKQVVDISTNLSHLGLRGESKQMVKCILDGESKGSFYGTIVVDEKAKFTNAYQTNRNILAAKTAKMYTRPQLEIYCEEVKCSHGATVGQLDANALFYMRQRGIPEDEAKMMLMQAFMADVIEAIEIPALKSRLHQLIERRLAGYTDLCGDCSAHP